MEQEVAIDGMNCLVTLSHKQNPFATSEKLERFFLPRGSYNFN